MSVGIFIFGEIPGKQPTTFLNTDPSRRYSLKIDAIMYSGNFTGIWIRSYPLDKVTKRCSTEMSVMRYAVILCSVFCGCYPRATTAGSSFLEKVVEPQLSSLLKLSPFLRTPQRFIYSCTLTISLGLQSDCHSSEAANKRFPTETYILLSTSLMEGCFCTCDPNQ